MNIFLNSSLIASSISGTKF